MLCAPCSDEDAVAAAVDRHSAQSSPSPPETSPTAHSRDDAASIPSVSTATCVCWSRKEATPLSNGAGRGRVLSCGSVRPAACVQQRLWSAPAVSPGGAAEAVCPASSGAGGQHSAVHDARRQLPPRDAASVKCRHLVGCKGHAHACMCPAGGSRNGRS